MKFCPHHTLPSTGGSGLAPPVQGARRPTQRVFKNHCAWASEHTGFMARAARKGRVLSGFCCEAPSAVNLAKKTHQPGFQEAT